MAGDGMGGLATGIVLAIALMLAAGFGIAYWIGKRASGDGVGTKGAGRGLLFGVVGLGLAAVGVAATFYEASFSPPPRLDVVVPAGYARPWTIVLEDPRAAGGLDWQGSGLPFTRRSATLTVPSGGVVRVRSLGDAQGRGDLEVTFSDGASLMSNGGGPAPAGSGATGYLLLGRALPDGSLPEAPSGEALARDIAMREGH